MQTVIIGHDPLDPTTWAKHETDDVRELLMQEFAVWPEHARIYHNHISQDRDVTPHNEAEIDRLAELDGLIYVVNYPGAPLTIILAVVAVVAIAAVAFLFMPAVPALKNQQTTSPNNALADRSNQARPNGRIPDIFGTVRSTPDLLAVPYKIFKNNQEVEVAFMCVGKGHYEVDDILDDTTPVDQILGASVEVYSPGTSPRSGDEPIVRIGSPITDPLVKAKRYNSVNGQVLQPSSGASSYNVQCAFHYPNRIIAQPFTFNGGVGDDAYEIPTDLTQYFAPGPINVNASDVNGLNLSGNYIASAVTATEITLVAPATVNDDWLGIEALPSNETDYVETSLVNSGFGWVGPVVLDVDDLDMVIANIVGLNGLYKDDGKNKYAVNVECQLELVPLNANGGIRGPAENFSVTVYGSATDQSTRASTLYADPTFTGKCQARMRRLTPKDTTFKGTVVDEVKWRDVYAIAPITQTDFGDVTTVFATSTATEGATSLKDRKLNMLATRKLPQRQGDGSFSADLYPTNNAADIMVAMALDPFIGNRELADLDVDNFYNTVAEVAAYFGTTLATEFCYTFDSQNLSFEESFGAVAAAVFSIAFRRGRVISLFFEKETNDSSLLFNHRNKLPGSETRTVVFGRTNDYDGVEYQYVDPTDDAVISFYIPEDQSAVNAKKIESLGHRNHIQPYFAAWRVWQKIVYQNTTTEFDATAEADLLIVQERILVADNTRPDTQDGQVENQQGLMLALSQPFTPAPGVEYTIFIQHVDGSIEALPVTPGIEPQTVILTQPPRAALSTNPDNFAVATYWIVGNNEPRGTAFLLAEKSPKSNMTLTLKAINYDARYYAKDKDLVNGVIS